MGGCCCSDRGSKSQHVPSQHAALALKKTGSSVPAPMISTKPLTEENVIEELEQAVKQKMHIRKEDCLDYILQLSNKGKGLAMIPELERLGFYSEGKECLSQLGVNRAESEYTAVEMRNTVYTGDMTPGIEEDYESDREKEKMHNEPRVEWVEQAGKQLKPRVVQKQGAPPPRMESSPPVNLGVESSPMESPSYDPNEIMAHVEVENIEPEDLPSPPIIRGKASKVNTNTDKEDSLPSNIEEDDAEERDRGIGALYSERYEKDMTESPLGGHLRDMRRATTDRYIPGGMSARYISGGGATTTGAFRRTVAAPDADTLLASIMQKYETKGGKSPSGSGSGRKSTEQLKNMYGKRFTTQFELFGESPTGSPLRSSPARGGSRPFTTVKEEENIVGRLNLGEEDNADPFPGKYTGGTTNPAISSIAKEWFNTSPK